MIIGFTGDVMIGRLVNEIIKKTTLRYPWGDCIELLKKNDLSISNLETTLTRSKKKVFKIFNFRSEPEHVNVLVEGGIDIVSLANNHSLDFADEGLIETLQALDSKNIRHIGAGTTIDAARKAVVMEKNGIRIGILGYTDNEPDWLATETKPGINYLQVGDIDRVKEDIARVRDKVDILIATLHWGPNMRQHPSPEFIDFAHKLIDNGIDIIHGHSAHIFQGIELYKNKVIMYDTGDFVDDYMVTPELRNDQSFLFRITVTKQGTKSIELIPTFISNMQVNIAPKTMAREILEKMSRLCAKFGTTIEIRDNKGYITIQ